MEAVGVGMLITHGRDGEFLARPMRLRIFEGDRGLWFLSRKESRKVVNIRTDGRVAMTFVDLDGNAYVSARGVARIEEGREHVHRLWSEQADSWFPEGKDDPGVVAIRIDLQGAEYWDDTASTPSAHARKAEKGLPVDSDEHLVIDLR